MRRRKNGGRKKKKHCAYRTLKLRFGTSFRALAQYRCYVLVAGCGPHPASHAAPRPRSSPCATNSNECESIYGWNSLGRTFLLGLSMKSSAHARILLLAVVVVSTAAPVSSVVSFLCISYLSERQSGEHLTSSVSPLSIPVKFPTA